MGGTVRALGADSVETTFAFSGEGSSANLYQSRALAADSLCHMYVADENNRVLQVNLDADGDGLCDSWERDGVLVRGSPARYVFRDANIDIKDLYVEVDYMDSVFTDTSSVKTMLQWAFSGRQIFLHLDFDEKFPNAAWLIDGMTALQTIKASHFGSYPSETSNRDLQVAKSLGYHYGVLGESATTGFGGEGEVRGNDFYTTIGWARAPGALLLTLWLPQL